MINQFLFGVSVGMVIVFMCVSVSHFYEAYLNNGRTNHINIPLGATFFIFAVICGFAAINLF